VRPLAERERLEEGTTMQANIQEIYANTIHPLTSDDKLRIAALILEEVTGKSPVNGGSQTPERKDDITKNFGLWEGGDANDSDTEQIDADLAREYANEPIRPKRTPLGARERREAMNELLLYAGAVSSGNPHAADNEGIDADLAREYGKDL
jgi:hypothetical protein